MEPITSHSNARLKHARKLQTRRNRRALGQFLAEGEDIVSEALSAGILPVETLIAAERPPEEGRCTWCETRSCPRSAASATRPA
jgi:tRNA G18 (ribose-2'-O)-methylase SpoU